MTTASTYTPTPDANFGDDLSSISAAIADHATRLNAIGAASAGANFLKVDDFGAIGDGVTDDGPAFAAAFAALGATGGLVTINPSKKYYIAATLTVPKLCGIAGQLYAPGEFNITVPQNFANIGSQLILNSAATLSLGHASWLANLAILRQGVGVNPSGSTYPTNSAAVKAAMAGIAVTIAGNNVGLERLLILGFTKAVSSDGYSRLQAERVFFDCTNGFYIANSYDVFYLNRCHGWPFLTQPNPNFNVSGDVGLVRSGNAFEFGDVNDGGKITDCFSFGYETGFLSNGSKEITFTGCWADYPPSIGSMSSIGFHFYGQSRNIAVNGCQASSTGRGLVTNISNTDSAIIVTNWRSWVCMMTHIENYLGEMVLVAPRCIKLGGASNTALKTSANTTYTTMIAAYFEDFTATLQIGTAAKFSNTAPRYVNCTGY